MQKREGKVSKEREWEVVSLGQFMDNPPELPDAILEPDLLYPGGKMEIYGVAKGGKSFLAQQLAMCIASGTDWVGYRVPRSCKTLYLQGEVSKVGLYKRLTKASQGYDQARVRAFLCTAPDRVIGEREDVESLGRIIVENGIEVIVIDPLYHFLTGSESSGEDTGHFLRLLSYLQTVTGAAIVIIHHSRKSLTFDGKVMDAGFGEAKGSTNLVQWPDTVVRLHKVSKDVRELRWEGVRHGIEPPDKTLIFNGENCRFEVLTNNPAEVIINQLGEGPLNAKDLKALVMSETGLSLRQVERILNRAVEQGQVEMVREKGDKRKVVYKLVSWKGEQDE